MVFLDINTFFSPKAGGIRTYHQAKIAWFRNQPGHRYHLIFPGPGHAVRDEGNVRLEEAFGPAMTPDPSGYRLLIDFPRVLAAIRSSRPAVLEAGDPWLTGLFCLLLRRLGLYRGLLVSFYHSDPIPSYLEPWAARGSFRFAKRLLVRLVAPAFYRLQRGYDLTAVASLSMEASLRARGVRRVAHLPFGVAGTFLEPLPPRRAPGEGDAPAEVRLLYAGRLDREKGVDLLLSALPDLLGPDVPGGAGALVSVSVAGRGAYADRFAGFAHPRYRFLGFLDGPAQVRDAYDSHHVLLAPGPFETFGLGVLEAMARGLLVVGPDRGGTGELLAEAASPFVFRADDAADFLRAARSAVAAAAGARYAAEARRSREVAERYGSWDDAMARQAASYAEEAASAASPARDSGESGGSRGSGSARAGIAAGKGDA